MKFSKDWPKLKNQTFTTIRKRGNRYQLGRTYTIVSPSETFRAKLVSRETLKKSEISDGLARKDANCTRIELLKILEKWYGKEFDDFEILYLRREATK